MNEYKEKPYAELDALILDALNCRPTTFSALSVQPRISDASNNAAKPNAFGQRVGWRVVDRRLQALRKAGKVKVSREAGWELV